MNIIIEEKRVKEPICTRSLFDSWAKTKPALKRLLSKIKDSQFYFLSFYRTLTKQRRINSEGISLLCQNPGFVNSILFLDNSPENVQDKNQLNEHFTNHCSVKHKNILHGVYKEELTNAIEFYFQTRN